MSRLRVSANGDSMGSLCQAAHGREGCREGRTEKQKGHAQSKKQRGPEGNGIRAVRSPHDDGLRAQQLDGLLGASKVCWSPAWAYPWAPACAVPAVFRRQEAPGRLWERLPCGFGPTTTRIPCVRCHWVIAERGIVRVSRRRWHRLRRLA